MQSRNNLFLSEISERKNRFIEQVLKIRNQGGRLYIWGGGLGASQVAFLLKRYNISFDGFVVNKKYLTPQLPMCLAIEDVCEKSEDNSLHFIIAFRGYSPEIIAPYRQKIKQIIDMDTWAGLSHYDGETIFSWQWVEENSAALEFLYSALEDELSRKTLLAYCNQKISMDYRYLEKVRQEGQYFDHELITLSDHEVFVDCGGYDGDSAAVFINALKSRGFTHYDEIISFEPSSDNFIKLKNRKFARHRCIQKGCSDHRGRQGFKNDDTSSVCTSDANLSFIELDTIDNVLAGGRATMIKMDIEGEELNALYGAEQTIRKWEPALAICVYHKPEDLIAIPHFIKSTVPDYKLYLRAYERTATEVVLYAIP